MGKEINVYHLRTASYEKEINKVVDGKTVKKKVKMGGTPYATVAITFNSDGTVNRGVSICSPRDAFVRTTGVAKAVGRMRKAMHTISNVYPIIGYKHLENKIAKKHGAKINGEVNFAFLGYYHAEPNAIEKRIFKKELGC